MNRSHLKKSATALVGLALIAAMGGCNQQMVRGDVPRVKNDDADCTVPLTKDVGQAFVTSKVRLGNSGCYYRFDDHEEQLMLTAAGNPGELNKRHFFDFYNWAADQGVISKIQAKERYSRFFSTRYGASLPDTYANCGIGSRLDGILDSLKAEAHQKKRGLGEVVGDRDAWFEAKSNHDNLVLILETTAQACMDQG